MVEDKNMSIHNYKVGDYAEISKTFLDQDLKDYAKASGDNNPLHMDDQYAATTIFGERIIQGMLIGGLISAVIGTKFPGNGTIYLSQNLKFIKPVRINDEITAHVEVAGIDIDKERLILTTTCYTKSGNLVVIGDAVVIPPKN